MVKGRIELDDTANDFVINFKRLHRLNNKNSAINKIIIEYSKRVKL